MSIIVTPASAAKPLAAKNLPDFAEAAEISLMQLSDLNTPSRSQSSPHNPPAMPTISQADLDLAYERGVKAGEERAQGNFKREQSANLQALTEQLNATLQTSYLPLKREVDHYHHELHNQCVRALHKIAHSMGLSQLPARLEAILNELINACEPTALNDLTISINPDDVAACQEINQRLHADIAMKFVSDKKIEKGDAFVEWQDGSLNLNKQNIQSLIREAIDLVAHAKPENATLAPSIGHMKAIS